MVCSLCGLWSLTSGFVILVPHALLQVRHSEVPVQRTKTVYGSKSPVWKEDFRVELVKDKRLLDAPVEFKVWNYNSMTSDYIGTVLVQLHPLLRGKIRAIDGWFPVFDCLKGIRGWLRVCIRVDLIDNVSQFANTDFSVRIFSGDVPTRYQITRIFGFVEELVVEDDPEFHWNKFRASRTTNDQRVLLMYHITGKLRRKLQLKVHELGGNAITRFEQHFDFEGEGGGGIVARAYGTCVLLSKKTELADSSKEQTVESSAGPFATPAEKLDFIPIVPGYEIPLLTLRTLPPYVNYRIGGVVMSRSIKLVKSEHRRKNHDKWWSALRSEIFAHTKKLHCNIVLGYSENSVVIEDICVLTASGTACFVIQETNDKELRKSKKKKKKKKTSKRTSCSTCHIPFLETAPPFPFRVLKCNVCKKKYVPEMLYSTTELPTELAVEEGGRLIQARVSLPKKKADGETGAIAVSEAIPFMEYDLHKELLLKLRSRGCNAVFGLKMDLSVGESMMTCVATGTAVRLSALATPAGSIAVGDDDSASEASTSENQDIEPSEEASAFHYFGDREDRSETGDGATSSVILESDEIAKDLGLALPEGLRIATVEKIPQVVSPHATVMFLSFIHHAKIPARTTVTNEQLAKVFGEVYSSLAFKLFNCFPCTVYGAKFQLQHPGENDVQVLFTGTAVSDCVEGEGSPRHLDLDLSFAAPTADDLSAPTTPVRHRVRESGDADLLFELDDDGEAPPLNLSKSTGSSRIMSEYTSMPSLVPRRADLVGSASGFAAAPSHLAESSDGTHLHAHARGGDSGEHEFGDFSPSRAAISMALLSPRPQSMPKKRTHSVMVTSLSYVPHAKIKRYLGHICMHMIKERLDRRGETDQVAYSFIHEALAAARSHVVAIGGNALVCFSIETLAINDSTNYCLLIISGDAVVVQQRSAAPSSHSSSPLDSHSEPFGLSHPKERTATMPSLQRT
eukprot:TRINITY_DN2046_c0_g1_i2.p1 TRINITY_DN2046_c0_g1~~TRINITY_DN2046_c0_g1_i2.p1  ORF type:complete len:964 (+),score=215.00 TRINITY_DN2046_c0_g1_i2:36-2927(+)